MYKRIAAILTITLAAVIGCHANVHRFVHFTGKEGLPHQQIETMAFDSKGLLWIGTRNGLSNYDGYRFNNYFHDPANPRSLNHNFVKALYIDRKNRIWVGTNKGICRYIPSSDDFKCYDMPNSIIQSIVENNRGEIICAGRQLFMYNEKKDEFTRLPRQDSGFIISMAVDKRDNLYISTNKSIFYYDPSFSRATQIKPQYFVDFITGADGIIPLKFDSHGRLWVGRNGKGVMNIDLTTGRSEIYPSDKLSDGTVRVISEDRDGGMWLGTEKGITLIKPDGTIEIIRQDFSDKNKLNDNAIYAITPDRDNNIWIGTYFGGINVLFHDNEQFHWIEPGYGSKNIKGKAVREMVEPEAGRLWIATEDGGLNILDMASGIITPFTAIPALGQNVHSLYYDRDTGNMWIGTFRHGLFRYNLRSGAYTHFMPEDTPGLESDAIFDIVKSDKDAGNIWIATTQGLRCYDEASGSFKKINQPSLDRDFIYTLMVDRDGNLWAGSCNYGLFRIDATSGEINNWSSRRDNSSLQDDYITCLYQDSKNRIWFGTNNEGIRYINPLDMKVSSLDKGLSLPQSSVCSIIEDRLGDLWVSTSDGLFRYNKERNAMTRYTTEDGLPSNQFNFASDRVDSGVLYFGTVNGFVFFDPSIIKGKTRNLEVHFGRLTVDNNVVTSETPGSPLTDALDNMERLTLSYGQSRLFAIEYGVIMPGNTASVRYQVKLSGVDSKWRDVGQERRFVGLNLAPGTYLLQVRATNSDSRWDDAPVRTLKIVIEPPFYRSVWAYLFYLLLAAAASYYIARFIAMRVREKNAVRIANLEKEKMEEINQAKMDFFTSISHELKTPLSLIKAPLMYIAQHDRLDTDSRHRLETAIKNTDRMVGMINELVTFNKIEGGNSQFYIQKGDPVDFIEKMAALFKDFAAEKKIQLYIHCENNGEEVWFSPIYVERIVNNLISNALKFTPENGTVIVKAGIMDNPDGYTYLRIEVRDTGIGIAKEEFGNIFRKYYQTKRGHNVDNKGWGIGLSLVKRLAEIHKGSVWVDSELGKGSTFVVCLNVSENAFDAKSRINSDKTLVTLDNYKFESPLLSDINQESQGEDKKVGAESKLSIMIVEDNEELLKFLSDYFSAEYNVFTAHSGKKALEIAHKYPIQLVISDVMMSEMDGYTLCSNLKNDVSTSHIPVILLTAKSDTDDMLKGYESGAEAYVVKPFDPQILDLQVKNIIHVRRERIDNIVNKEDRPVEEEKPSGISKFDEEFINKINKLVEDNLDNDNFSVVDITKAMCISRSLLHVKMKSLLNISMGEYIRKKRIALACRLLREGYNVSETAYKTGFSDPNYFSKVFKRECGMTPTEYIDNKPTTEQTNNQ